MTCKDGFGSSNKNLRRTEPLITVDQLKRRFLHGIETKDNFGNEISDETYQEYIDMVISMLEADLDIVIKERDITEEKDYHGNDYWEWGFLQLNNIPAQQFVQGRDSMKVTYLRDENGQPETVLEIPANWIRLREHDGLIRLVPNNKFPASLQIDASGTFFPEIFRRHSLVPQLWTIQYRAGFPDGCVPMIINAAIGYLAAIIALNNSADLILGTGIASTSLSIDGLSQSINSTSSAENTNNSAKVKEYYKSLFGDGINSPNQGLIRILRNQYSGERLNII